jgi:CSLREA domain-containing protein
VAEPSFAAGVVTVNTTSDGDAADGSCTLREAIKSINNNAAYNGCANSGGADIIDLPAGVNTITFTMGAPPPITNRWRTIRGQGYAQTTISGNVNAGPFQVNAGGGLGLMDLTVRSFFSAPLSVSAGGSAGLTHVRMLGSSDGGSGGCIYNAGSVSINASQLELCRAFSGGAIYNATGGSMYIDRSTILKNFGEHGVIVNYQGTLQITSSTIGANKSGNWSAGIFQYGGNVSVSMSTFAYNTCTDSSSCAVNGAHHLSNDPAGGGTMSIDLSVVYNEIGFGRECYGTITSYGNNAYTSGTVGAGCNFFASGDRTVSNARLNPITVSENGYINLPRFAGGVGRVYVPEATSPLVAQVSGPTLFGDQRGVRRRSPLNDIGSVQTGSALLVVGNTTLSIADQVIQTQLQTLGFAVTVKLASAAASSDATGKTLVVISESCASADVNTKFRTTSTGALVLELAVYDDMSMTTAANLGTLNASQVNLVRGTDSNFLAGPAGYYGVVTTTGGATSYGWGTPPSGAGNYAQDVTTASRKMAFYFAAGSPMVGGFSAPGRRVGAFMTNSAAAVLQAPGVRLLQEAILLASGPTAF